MWEKTFIAFLSLTTFGIAAAQISTHPVVLSRIGDTASLTCHSKGVPIRLCLWEQKETDKLLATIDISPSLSTSLPGYAHSSSDDLAKGNCGLIIQRVKPDDIQRYKCTLFARNNASAIFRGTVLLQGAETLAESDGGNQPQSQSSAGERSLLGVGRPIITAESPQENIVSSVASQPSPAIQEVQIQSGGIVIVARRKDRKLQIL